MIAAYRGGILRFASLMVDRPCARQAAELAKANPGLGVGLHLELCADRPELWGLRYFADPRIRRQAEPLIRGQIERFLSLGLKPTHADGHLNIHVHPVIFPALAGLCREYGIPRLRLPGGEWGAAAAYSGFRAGTAALSAVFGALRAYLAPQARGLTVPERTWGLLRSGQMSEEYLLALLARVPEGTTEIYLHPSSDPASRTSGRPTPTHQTIVELETLLSPRVAEAVKARGLSLWSAGEERG